MAIVLNHLIVYCTDKERSARFLTDLFDLAPPTDFSVFKQVDLAGGVALDFDEVDGPVRPGHYAFLVSEDEFTAIHARIVEGGIDHWADPGRRRAGEINHHDGGRGVYFADPDGHLLEIITRPYGGG